MITCPKCGRESHNPNDERERYCSFCHEFHDRLAVRSHAIVQEVSRRIESPVLEAIENALTPAEFQAVLELAGKVVEFAAGPADRPTKIVGYALLLASDVWHRGAVNLVKLMKGRE